MKPRKSFSIRLTNYIGIITSVLFIVVMLLFGYFSHKLIAEEAVNSAENLLNATIGNIENTLENVETSVKSNLWLIREHLNDRKYLHHITTGIIEDNNDITGSAVAFSQFYYGKEEFFSPFSYKDTRTGEIKQTLLGGDYDYFNMEWYTVPANTGKPAWSEPYFDQGGSDRLISTYSFPIRDDYGSLIAVATADVALEWIGRMTDAIKPYPNSSFTLISPSGTYLGVNEEGDLIKDNLFKDLSKVPDPRAREIAESMLAGKSGRTIFRTAEGHTAFAVYAPMENGWSASLVCNYRDVLKRASKMQLIIIVLGLLGLLALFVSMFFLIRRLTKPLSEFSESAMSIAKGDFNTTLPEIHSNDEIQQLSESFDYMQHSLLEYMENLKATTAAKERYESELNIASGIQNAMLPKDFPNMDGFELHAMMKPAKEVGGDLYDFHVRDGFAYFAIGDVSGKGVPAALFMAITRMAIHFFADYGQDLALRMTRINAILSSDNKSNMFVTVLMCCLNLETGELLYCNAGHNRAVLLHPGGKAEFLDQKPNLAVGVWPDFDYVMQKTTLEEGCKIILYTDGVTEAEKADKQQYGDDRLLEWARNSHKLGRLNAEQACEALHNDVIDFTEGNPQNDDITIMTIKYK